MPVEFEPLKTHASKWQPENCEVILNCCFQAKFVPGRSGHSENMRADASHLVVLDDFFGEEERLGLLQALTGSENLNPTPTLGLWEKSTIDHVGGSRTWGFKADLQKTLELNKACLEIQTRLENVLENEHNASNPLHPKIRTQEDTKSSGQEDTEKLAQENQNGEEDDESEGDELHNENRRADCANILANGPVFGDHYEYHVDIDPQILPQSEWRKEFGDYCNRDAGMPLLVSLLLYLVDENWDSSWHGETLFLDTIADVGICVKPKKYRAVLMDQDVYHRIVAPSKLAKYPRYSLVWKLAFLPKFKNQADTISRPEWGKPAYFASAQKLQKLAEKS